ncbi:MAG: hypothetical protein NC084_06035 [Bacteroides sp.]|nr:hypothetical protein [Eubacterium sp.]MCM1418117.1 hypothetical protein [Roseburia sp.]MCM1462259.1 hypothetical protein [Bacteroides sp.]
MKKVILLILFIPLGVLALLFLLAPVLNDGAAKRTAEELADLPLPERSELVEIAYKAGKLTGSGNGMQYFGAILLKSELSPEELSEFYSGEAKVKKQTGSNIEPIEHGDLAFQSEVGEDGYYIVYSWGRNDGFFHEIDLRGH